MKKDQSNKILKKYPFQFTKLTIAAFVAALVLCVAGFALTTWRFYNFLQLGADSAYQWIQYIILYFVSVLLSVLIIAMFARSQYIITEKQVILQFGIIKTKYEIKNIFSLHLFKGTNKLTVYFDDYHSQYTIIVVKETWYHDFIQTLCSIKPSIEFSFSSAEEDEQDKKN